MKQSDVKVGSTYLAKVNGKDARVRVLRPCAQVEGARLRFEVEPVEDESLRAVLAPVTAQALRPDPWAGVTHAITPKGQPDLPLGRCAVCERTDVLLHRGSEGTGPLRVTLHDDKQGVRCEGGGVLAEAGVNLPPFPPEVARDQDKAAAFGTRYAQQGTVADMLTAAQPHDPAQVQDEVIVRGGLAGFVTPAFVNEQVSEAIREVCPPADPVEARKAERRARNREAVGIVEAMGDLCRGQDDVERILSGPLAWPAAVEALPSGDIPLVEAALGRFRLGARPAQTLTRGQQRVLPAMERGGLLRRLQGGSSAHGMTDAYELTPAGTAALARVRR